MQRNWRVVRPRNVTKISTEKILRRLQFIQEKCMKY